MRIQILLIADDPRWIDTVTTAAHLIDKLARPTARDPIDTSSILGHQPSAMLVRISRRDFDAAADAIAAILDGCQREWAGHARIIIEERDTADLAREPITRHLGQP